MELFNISIVAAVILLAQLVPIHFPTTLVLIVILDLPFVLAVVDHLPTVLHANQDIIYIPVL